MGGSAALALLVATTAACASRPKPDLDQPVGITTARAAPIDVEVPRPEVVPPPPSDPACPLPLPSFVFPEGSAIVSPSQDFELQRLAACLTVGPFRGARVVAIGHGDAVGGDLENLGLGLERAGKIRAFLVAHGVSGERVVATSSGERSTEATRPGRRVDLVMVPAPPAAPPRVQ